MEQMDNRQSIVEGIRNFIEKILKGNFAIEITETPGKDSSALKDILKDDQWILLSTGILPIGHVGVSISWIPILSKTILNMDKNATGEVADDLIKEFVGKMVYEQLPEHVKGDKALKDILSVVKPVQLEKSLKNASFRILDFHISGSLEENETQDVEASLFLILFAVSESNEDSQITSSKSLMDEAAMPDKTPDFSNKVEFEEFRKETSVKNDFEVRNIEILKDVEMDLSVELGKQEMPLGDILKLVKGSVIELNKMAGEPVEILVNGFRIALGEVVVIDEHFGVRVTSLVSERERMKSLV